MGLSNSQYDQIMRGYSLLQAQAQRDLALRRREAYRRIPQLAELDRAAGKAGLEQARKLMEGSPDDSRFREMMETISGERTRLLREHSFPEDYLEPRYQCPDCRDTGYIGREKCHCFRSREIELFCADSGMKEDLETENFSRFSFEYYSSEAQENASLPSPRENMHEIVSQCRDFIDRFDTQTGYLLFYGEAGLGKTFLSHCVAKELIDSLHSVLYYSAPVLFEEMARHAFSREENSSGGEILLTCDLLIIDDLGTELVNSFVASSLFQLLNDRMRRGKSLLISTNLSLADLQDMYSERVSSRITSQFTLLHFYGSDIRLQKRLMSGEEAFHGNR